jgi:hypothetical protein
MGTYIALDRSLNPDGLHTTVDWIQGRAISDQDQDPNVLSDPFPVCIVILRLKALNFFFFYCRRLSAPTSMFETAFFKHVPEENKEPIVIASLYFFMVYASFQDSILNTKEWPKEYGGRI